MVVALGLMSFVLIILLSFTVVVGVETANAAQSIDRLKARENAKLGALVALGDLQKHAGQDLRVSARADSQGAGVTDPNTQLWTGIWSSDLNGGVLPDPVWLVSGFEPDATQALDPDTIEMYPATTDKEAVRAPRVSIDSLSSTDGSFAYWVSDESTKARINFDQASDQMPYIATDAERQDIQEEYLNFPAQDKIFPSLEPLEDTTTESFQRIYSRAQVALIEPTALIEDTFHDYSLTSSSVLTNMLNGGLKQNLTGATEVDLTNLLAEAEYEDDTYLSGDYLGYFNIDPLTGNSLEDNANADIPLGPQPQFNAAGELVRRTVDDFFDYRTNDLDSQDGETEPIATVMPIVSEVSFRLGAFHTQSDAKHRIRFHADVEFWNPYPYPIRMPSDSGGFFKDRCFIVMLLPSEIDEDGVDTEKMILSIQNRNLPEEIHTNLLDFDEDLGSVLGGGPNDNSLNETVLQSWMVIDDVVLQPGEVYHATTGQTQGLARDAGGYILRLGGDENKAEDYVPDPDHDYTKWSWHTAQKPSHPVLEPDHQIDVDLRMPAGGLTFRIINFSSSLQNNTSPVYEDDVSNEWAEPVWELRNIYKGSNPPTVTLRGDEYSRSSSGSYTINNYNIGFHFRLADELVFGANPDASDLALRFDLRQPVWDYDDPAVRELVEITEENPFNVSSLANLFDGTDVIADANSDTHGGTFERAFLFNAPKREPLSVGALNRLPLSFETIDYDVDGDGSDELVQKRIGMPWGDELNEAFDKYFYSGAPNANWVDNMPLALAQLKPTEATTNAELREFDAANKLLMEGGFNINTTSVQAWEAMLSRTIHDYDYGAFTPINLENAFLNLAEGSDSAAETVGVIATEDTYNSGDAEANGRLAMRQSIRRLTDAQITRLATEIVDAVKDYISRESLFSNLSEFVNSGILDEAIRSADINGTIAKYSPAYISQNLIFEMLAPYLTTRGDTFTIRAFGSSTNATTGQVLAETYCEVIVQRMPERIDNNLARRQEGSDTNGNTFGRRFEIVDVQWLSPN